MLTIQVMTSTTTLTHYVESPFEGMIRLRPCLFCETGLVELPDKFCCDSHRKLYHYYGIGKPVLTVCVSK